MATGGAIALDSAPMETEANQTGARPGIFEKLKAQAASVIGTSRTRIDNFSSEIENRIFHFLAMLLLRLVLFVCLSLGLMFAMLTVIFGFHLSPRYAFGIPAAVFLLIGLVAFVMLKIKKHTAPGRR